VAEARANIDKVVADQNTRWKSLSGTFVEAVSQCNQSKKKLAELESDEDDSALNNSIEECSVRGLSAKAQLEEYETAVNRYFRRFSTFIGAIS